MGTRNQRTSDRLFPNGTRWAFLAIFVAAVLFLGSAYFNTPLPQVEVFGVTAEAADESDSEAPELPASPQAVKLDEKVRKAIENLFEQLDRNPEAKDRILRELRRLFHDSLAGQEDCWSCEGAVYFDKFDQIAGFGEARKPIGLREWLQDGDEAFQEQRLDEARKYYSEALQVLDERALQEEGSLDASSIERLRQRCEQLGCR